MTFAVALPALLVAHSVADHWVQTGHQALTKGQPGWPGRLACARHVATYTATTAVTVGGLWVLLDLPITPAGFVAGQLVSVVTHYWADRRFTLARMCERLGKGEFYRLGQPRDVKAQRYTLTNGAELVRLFTPVAGSDPELVPWDNPTLGTGAYALDQSWHHGWLLVAALLTAAL